MKTTMRELQEQALDTLKDCIRAGDAKRFAAAYSKDASLIGPGLPELRGQDAIAKYYQEWFDGFGDLTFGWARVFAKGDVLIAEWAWSGTNTGRFMGRAATNKPAGALGASVLWFDDRGAIRAEHRYSDTATAAGQLGHLTQEKNVRPIPTPPPATEWIVSTGLAEEDRNMDPIHAIHVAVDEKDEAGYLAALTDDVAYDDLTRPEPIEGQDGAKNELKAFMAAFPDAKFTHANEWCIGPYAIVESTMTGTPKGPFGAENTKAIKIHVIDIALIEGGKCAKGVSYGNRYELWTQLGFVKKAPPPTETSAIESSAIE